MTLLFILLTLAVLGVVVAVAIGKITGGLGEPSSSLPAQGLPAGEVQPDSLDAVRFSPALRGYRMSEVDAVLDRLTHELARRDDEISRLRQEMISTPPGFGEQGDLGGERSDPDRNNPDRGNLDQAGGDKGYGPGDAGRADEDRGCGPGYGDQDCGADPRYREQPPFEQSYPEQEPDSFGHARRREG